MWNLLLIIILKLYNKIIIVKQLYYFISWELQNTEFFQNNKFKLSIFYKIRKFLGIFYKL